MDKRRGTTTAASLVVGVTGHRNLRESGIPELQGQVRDFFLALQRRFPELPLTLISSLAAGSDQLVAQVGFELGLRVIAPLPISPELYRDSSVKEILIEA